MKFFFDDLMGRSAYIWPRILRYNSTACGDLGFLANSEFDTPSLRAWLAEENDTLRLFAPNLEPTFFWDFDENSRKIALLDDQELFKLVRLSGVALHGRDLARVITRAEHLALKELLGEDLLSYAQFLGQYQAGQAYDLFVNRDLDIDLGVRSLLHGWMAVYLCSLEWPKALGTKFRERLEVFWREKGEADIMADPWPNMPHRLAKASWETLWRFLQRCLLCEVVPSWAPYFKK